MESAILNFLQGHKRVLAGGGGDEDGESSVTKEIVFTIIFYGLFILMLISFYMVFKKSGKNEH